MNPTGRLTWKTAQPQYNPQTEGLLVQNNLQKNGAGKIQKKLDKVRFESRPRKRQRPMPPEDEETDSPIIISSDEDEQKDQEEGHPLNLPLRKRRETHPICTPLSHLPTPHLEMMTGKQKVPLSWSLLMKIRTP